MWNVHTVLSWWHNCSHLKWLLVELKKWNSLTLLTIQGETLLMQLTISHWVLTSIISHMHLSFMILSIQAWETEVVGQQLQYVKWIKRLILRALRKVRVTFWLLNLKILRILSLPKISIYKYQQFWGISISNSEIPRNMHRWYILLTIPWLRNWMALKIATKCSILRLKRHYSTIRRRSQTKTCLPTLTLQ